MQRPTKLNTFTHGLKDPANLTEYEQKLWDLKAQGLSYAQIAKQMGSKANPRTLASRYHIIKEKIKLWADR